MLGPVRDPYAGMTYSQVIDLDDHNRKVYRENPSPVRRVPGHGRNLTWDRLSGRWHVIR